MSDLHRTLPCRWTTLVVVATLVVAAGLGCGPARGLGGGAVVEPLPEGPPPEAAAPDPPPEAPPQSGFARRIGGPGQEEVYGVAVAADGSVFVSGWFDESTDMDPGEGVDLRTSLGGGDAFVVRLDQHGDLMWARTVGGAESVGFFGLAIAPDGSVLLLGSFVASADFDPGAAVDIRTAVGSRDVLAVLLDESGSLRWAVTFGGAGEDGSWDAAFYPDGSSVVVGFYRETVDFSMGTGPRDAHTSAGDSDVFAVRLDAAGRPLWSRVVGGVEADAAVGVGVAEDGAVSLTGSFRGTVDFDPGPGTEERTAAGEEDGFVLTLTPGGDFVRVVTFGSPGMDLGWDLAVAPDGGTVVTGSFSESVDFDPGPGRAVLTSKGSTELFVAAFDPAGASLWARGFGTEDEEWGRSVAVSTEGGVVALGRGSPDLVGLDLGGRYRWSLSIDPSADVNGRGVALAPSGDVVACGGFYDALSFGRGAASVVLRSDGDEEAFVIRLAQPSR